MKKLYRELLDKNRAILFLVALFVVVSALLTKCSIGTTTHHQELEHVHYKGIHYILFKSMQTNGIHVVNFTKDSLICLQPDSQL
jgi:hypothetical protein